MSANRYNLAAIMFTDLVGFTTAMGKDEARAMKMLSKSRNIHKKLISDNDGVFVKEMGDGNLAKFNSANNAVLCAQEILLQAQDLECKIRIGIHLGDVRIENDDVFGNGVNVASRLQSIAEPGGIFISNSVYHAIRSNPKLTSKRIGDVELKNVSELIETYVITGKGLAFPSTTRIRELTGRGSISALAILPFKNLSNNSEQQYFVDGMQDALIRELSNISALRVISRTSTLRYRDTTKTVPEIAGELGVDGILEATVFRLEDWVRINVQLIKAYPREEHMWSGAYEKEIKNIFTLINEVVKDIASQIDAQLTSRESENLNEAEEVDPKALEAYLKGLFHWEKLNSNDLKISLAYFEEATNIAPSFAPALLGAAGVWSGRMQMGLIPPDQAVPKIKSYIEKTFDLDANIAEAHFWHATLKVWVDWDWQGGKVEFEKALELNPNHSLARAYYSHLLAIMGSFDESLHQMEIAIDLDPFNLFTQSLYGMALNYAREYSKAIEILIAILHDNNNHPVALSTLRSTYHNQENFSKAFEIFKQSYSEQGNLEAVNALEKEYKENGYHSALAKIAELMISSSDEKYYTPWQIATLYTRAEVKDKAIEFLKEAYRIRDPNMPYIGVDPIFDVLKDEEGFNTLLKKLKLGSGVRIPF